MNTGHVYKLLCEHKNNDLDRKCNLTDPAANTHTDDVSTKGDTRTHTNTQWCFLHFRGHYIVSH